MRAARTSLTPGRSLLTDTTCARRQWIICPPYPVRACSVVGVNDADSRVREQTERILNLLIALRAASGWIDRDSLKACMDEYAGLSDAAFDRAFSRDKRLLRDLGIEISTATWDDEFTGRNGYGYRITSDDYELPEIDLTPQEAAVLSVASRFWQDSALGEASGRALHKLRGLGIDLAESTDPLPARMRFGTETFAAALSAVNARRAVRFSYRKPGGVAGERRLEPYALLTRGDRVYLLGRDLDKEEIRTFRLSRISGTLSRVHGRKDGDYTVPEDFRPGDWFRPVHASGASTTAHLRLRPGSGDPLRRAGTPAGTDDAGWDLLALGYDDPEELAATLVGFGRAVEVDSPADLADALERMRGTTLAALTAAQDAPVAPDTPVEADAPGTEERA